MIISSSFKQLEIMIKKYSLFFQVSLFGKSFRFSDKNRFYFNIIFLRIKLGKKRLFQFFLKEENLKCKHEIRYIPVKHNRRASSFSLLIIYPLSCKKISLMMVQNYQDRDKLQIK